VFNGAGIPPQYDQSDLRGRQGREGKSAQTAIPLLRDMFIDPNAYVPDQCRHGPDEKCHESG